MKVEVLRQGPLKEAGSDAHNCARAATPLASWSWQLRDMAPAKCRHNMAPVRVPARVEAPVPGRPRVRGPGARQWNPWQHTQLK